LATQESIVQAPVVPSKWDIIPIHTSDRGTFKQCRRRWAWSSPSRFNLVPRIASMGWSDSRMALWFGTRIHHALEHYYGKLAEDPFTVFETAYHLDLYGGLVHESELHAYADRVPVPGPQEGTYVVQGILDLLSDPDDWEPLPSRAERAYVQCSHSRSRR